MRRGSAAPMTSEPGCWVRVEEQNLPDRTLQNRTARSDRSFAIRLVEQLVTPIFVLDADGQMIFGTAPVSASPGCLLRHACA